MSLLTKMDINASGHFLASNLLDKASKSLTGVSVKNYAGIFKCLASKVRSRQFILDSLFALSVSVRANIRKAGHEVLVVRGPKETVYSMTRQSFTMSSVGFKSELLGKQTQRLMKFKLIEYEPEVFQSIRQTEQLDDESLFKSLELTSNLSNIQAIAELHGGSSGSFIFKTFDNQLILKTISSIEKRIFLTEVLGKYWERIKAKDSQLVSVLGVYQLVIGHNSINLMLMNNVANTDDIKYRFDLKGSYFNRQVLDAFHDPDSLNQHVLKDVDFSNLMISIELTSQDRSLLIRRLKGDVEMLTALGLMDYSLLVIIAGRSSLPSRYMYSKAGSEDQCYLIAIIDINQKYCTCKRIESAFKCVFYRVPRNSISALGAQSYGERFLSFIKEVVVREH
jgi:hypothetical protein